MTDSEEEYLGSRELQRILLEAASDLVRKEHHMGRHGGCVVQPCGSASSHNVPYDNHNNAETDEEPREDPYYLRKSFSSPAIPELGRQLYYSDARARRGGETSEADDTGAPYLCRENRVNMDDYTENYSLQSTRGRERHRREVRQDHPYRERSDQEDPHRELSSDGSYEVIDLSTIEMQLGEQEQDTPQHYVRDPRAGWAEEEARRAYYQQFDQQYDSDGEESYLEESPLCSNRPIIRILDEGDTGGETARSDPGPLGYSRREQLEFTTAEHREALYGAERYITNLKETLHRVTADRDNLLELHNVRTGEWIEVKERLEAEIVELREQNTTLLCDRLNKGGRMNKRLASTLIKAKQESDRALATTLERQQKINELRLLVTMQQRYILSMEDTMRQMGEMLTQRHGQDNNQPQLVEKEFPMRHPAEAQVHSGLKEVLDCDRGNYIPGTTTDPDLATTQVFDFPAGESQYEDVAAFNMMKVPYVRGALSMV